jgi:hypothetical protein
VLRRVRVSFRKRGHVFFGIQIAAVAHLGPPASVGHRPDAHALDGRVQGLRVLRVYALRDLR